MKTGVRQMAMLMLRIVIPILVLGFTSTKGAAWDTREARVTRTFKQVWRSDADRPPRQWDELFDSLRDLGFSEVIVQWSSYGTVSFYEDPDKDHESKPLMTPMIQSARRYGFKVWMGLHYDPDFWKEIQDKRHDPKTYLDGRLKDLGRRLDHLALALMDSDPLGEVVIGWYISDEIDDENWNDLTRERALTDYLEAVSRQLHARRPKWPVMISGFSNGVKSPRQLADFWSRLIRIARIDTMLFQDGIGTEKLSLPELEKYLSFFSNGFNVRGHSFGVIVELFRIDAGAPTEQRLQPAAFSRIENQLSLAGAYSKGPITVFSAPDYLLASPGKQNDGLRRLWKRELKTLGNSEGFLK